MSFHCLKAFQLTPSFELSILTVGGHLNSLILNYVYWLIIQLFYITILCGIAQYAYTVPFYFSKEKKSQLYVMNASNYTLIILFVGGVVG